MTTIAIRRYEPADIPLLHAAAVESAGGDFTRWMPWCQPGYTLEQSSSFILSREKAWTDGEEYDFAIIDPATNELLGSVSLNQFNRDHRFANVGYWVRRGRMGQGIAPAAVRLAARFGFEELGLQRLEIVVAVGNERSQRVAEKVGAQREGVLRNRLLIADQCHDATMYSLVPG